MPPFFSGSKDVEEDMFKQDTLLKIKLYWYIYCKKGTQTNPENLV